MTEEYKLQILANLEGLHIMEMLELATYDSVAAGICMNEGCDHTTNVEPDQCAGWCNNCNTATVKSCLVLAGII